MPAPQNVIAVIFDFDDTLTDDSTTKLLSERGIDAAEFWKKSGQMIGEGWDPTLAYLHLLLENVGPGKPLGEIGNEQLRRFGGTLSFYSGIPGLFADLKSIANEHPRSIPQVEFYVISGGLEEIIEGSEIRKHLAGVRGCRFAEHNGTIEAVMNMVSFTEKTRYIFEINKGIIAPRSKRPSAYAVNESVIDGNRRVPFENMIYVGDGLTDIPCFSLITQKGGSSFGVFDPKKKDSPRKAWKLAKPRRTISVNTPSYTEDDPLGSFLRMAVREICVKMEIRTGESIPD
jgi:hypothetical protein